MLSRLRPARLSGRFDADATLRHLGHLSYLINAHGAPHLPRVPTVFSRYEPLARTCYGPDEQRAPAHWADDLFARTASESHAERLASHSLPRSEPDQLLFRPLSELWHRNAPGDVAYDIAGRSVCTYTLGDENIRGRMATGFLVQIATLRLLSAAPPDAYDACDHASLLVAALVFNGQGLEALNLLPELARTPVGQLSQARLGQELEHATLLAMVVRGLVPEQIIATYGPVLSPALRKRVWTLCQGFADYTPEVKLLRRLCAGTQCPESAQASLHRKFA